MSITVVGSVALDTITTPFGSIERGLGGAATHFAVSSSFYTNINLIGVVGKDFPEKHVNFLKSRDINLEGLEVADGETFHWVGKYEHDLNTAITLETHLNVFESFDPKVPENFKNPNILFLANIDPDLQRKVIDLAGKPNFIALDTMNLWIDIKKDSLTETIKKVDLVTINETEARMFTGESNLTKAAKQIQNLGPKIVVIKLGEYGAILFYEDRIFATPGYPLEQVYDPTGAGDTFAGGMLGYLDRTGKFDFDTLKTAIICGSVMASHQVEQFSCDRLRTLTNSDISKRFEAFETLSGFETLNL